MPRGLVAFFALLEALFVVGIGLLVAFLIGLVGWSSLSSLHATPIDIWRIAVQGWALGHGVPLHVTLDDASRIFPENLASFDLTLAPFGFAVVTALMGRRAGRRLADSDDATLVVALLVVSVAALTALALLSGQSPVVDLDVITGTFRVLIPFVTGLAIGWKPWESNSPSRPGYLVVPPQWRDVVDTAARIAGTTAAALIALSAFIVAVLLLLGFATEIALYESLHTGILGGLVVTVAQLALAPVAVMWTLAWIAGPGFYLGAGSIVSPFATTVGAVPALPLLGAIPESTTVGWWVTVIPGVIALVAGARFASGVRHSGPRFHLGNFSDTGRVLTTAAFASVIAALGFLFLGTYATGSAGPGRFAAIGIDAPVVAGILALGIFVGSAIGMVAGKSLTQSRALQFV